MIKEKGREPCKSPVSPPTEDRYRDQETGAQNDMNSQLAHVQTPTNGASHNLLSGSYIDVGQDIHARIKYNQHVHHMHDAPHEHEDFLIPRAAACARRQEPVQDEPRSRAKMWDPVKDCNDPSTIQLELWDNSTHHNSNEQFTDSTTSDIASTGLHPCHGDHPYGQAEDSRQQHTTSQTRETTSMGLLPYRLPQAMASGYPGAASMGLLPYHQPQASVSEYQGGVSMREQLFRDGYLESSAQNVQQSLESITRGAALMDIKARQSAHLHAQSRKRGYEFGSIESELPASTASHPLYRRENFDSSHDNSHSHSSFPESVILPHQIVPKPPQHVNRRQPQNPSANMSQALSMANYAGKLDEQSNYAEAVRAYERACTLFQEVIIKSCSFPERLECNDARNTCQARLEVLLRESAAEPSNASPEVDDQQGDDGGGRGKPQYSLIEDWALCHKEEEDLSWQEVAETPMFKGKRKHRSLSQRKHTIGKMGPSYYEAEKPWTEEENKKLCALGDAGKTLGDIHRKFRSRNAERCLKRYFRMKGCHTTGKSRTCASYQARDPSAALLSSPSPSATLRGAQNKQSSLVTMHQGQPLYSNTSVIDPISHGQIAGTNYLRSRQVPLLRNPAEAIHDRARLSYENAQLDVDQQRRHPSLVEGSHCSMQDHRLRDTPSHSSYLHCVENANYYTSAMSMNNTPSTAPLPSQVWEHMKPLAPSISEGLRASARQQRQATPPPSPSYQAELHNPTATTLDKVFSRETVGIESADRLSPSSGERPATSPSSSISGSSADAGTDSTPATSTENSPTTTFPPSKRYNSQDCQSAAADLVRKSRRPAHLATI